jgi:hypothetical protein
MAMELFGEGCEYKNDGATAGRLFCPSKPGGIDCLHDPADKNPDDLSAEKGIYNCGDWDREPVFICSW